MDPWSQVLLIVGILLILEGLPYFGLPEIFRRAAERLSRVAPGRLRVSGLVMLLLGLALLGLRRLLFF